MPKNKEELAQAEDFDKVKAEKYGDSLLIILDEYREERKKMSELMITQRWIYKQNSIQFY